MESDPATLDSQSLKLLRAEIVPTLRVVFSGENVVAEPPRTLPAGETEIGRTVAEPGLALNDPHASRLHARMLVEPKSQRAVLANVSSHGTSVDGESIDSTHLADGAVISMGRTLMVFRWDPRPAPADRAIAGLLGDTPAMRQIRASIETFAPSDAVVTLQGDTGSGKEVVARAIHAASRRRGPFVAVNCATIPEALAEGQLFGHASGAFTGGDKPADGFFRTASDGTLFLDEIGDLTPAVQAKLLRALETGAVTPLGTFRELPHRARVITATHRDLPQLVREGKFRSDLYARISDFVLEIPPLRNRREDILMLWSAAWKGELPPMEFALARALLLHSWPLNVRELVRLASQTQIRVGDSRERLERSLVQASLARSLGLSEPERLGPQSARPDAPTVRPVQDGPPTRDALEELLRKYGGVVSKIATATGRSRKQVYRWIEAHGIDPAAFRDRARDDNE